VLGRLAGVNGHQHHYCHSSRALHRILSLLQLANRRLRVGSTEIRALFGASANTLSQIGLRGHRTGPVFERRFVRA
jgi:hypothetical protein